MKRKAQQLGSSTLAVTLPADWTEEQSVKKGDHLVVQRDETSRSLLVVPDSQEATQCAVTIDASTLDFEGVKRAVRTQYVLGKQLIEIEEDESMSTPLLEAVADIERELMGVGVVQEGVDSVSIRCSVAPDDFDLPSLLDRLWRTEKMVRSEVVALLVESDLEAAERAAARRRQLNKLFYLFQRLVYTTYRNPQLNRSVGLTNGFPLIGYRSVAQDVVLMTESVCQVASLIEQAEDIELDDEMHKHVVSIAKALDGVAAATRQAVVDPDMEVVEEGREIIDVFHEEAAAAQRHLESARPEPLLTLQRILTALENSVDHAENSLQVATHFVSS
jgi:phosphate uptake regulator